MMKPFFQKALGLTLASVFLFSFLVSIDTTQAESRRTPREPLMCTKEYTPVCGAVQVQCVTTPCYPVETTFGNQCTFDNAQLQDPMITFLSEGECQNPGAPVNLDDQDNTDEGDMILCTMQYEPVCGVDGVTYGNACTAGKNPIAYNGECDALSQTIRTTLQKATDRIKAKQTSAVISMLVTKLENLLAERKEFMTRAKFTPEGAQAYERTNMMIQYIIAELQN